MKNSPPKEAVLLVALLLLLFHSQIAQAKPAIFKIASYNVENLFDLKLNGTEYKEYIPNNIFGWTKQTFEIKLNNIARVIKDLGADIIALQEIESREALDLLKNKLESFNVYYPFSEIADLKNTPVKCAVLSKFPIIEKTEIRIGNPQIRNILKIILNIEGDNLILFINHWKSKRGPESLRIVSARSLRKDIERLAAGVDFILLGDFNANYNEHETFLEHKKLNDTKGITGINHILGTLKNSALVNEELLTKENNNKYLYNLWLEIDKSRRWSYDSFGEKSSSDSIIISKELYDNKGISYLDNSFDKFDTGYLFRQNRIFRWQRAKNGKGKHLGEGYSDHLPVFAYFSNEAFQFEKNNRSENNELTSASLQNEHIYSETRLDLNTASEEELAAVSGIGFILSQRIIAGRPYNKVEDLVRIKGIGKKKLEKLRDYFTVKKE